MAAIQRFTFDFDFDAPEKPQGQMLDPSLAMPEPEPEPEEPPPPPPPTFSEEELQMAREQAFEKGREAGRQEAEMQTARMAACALEELARALPQMMTDAAHRQEQSDRNAVQIALAVVHKVLPEAVRLSACEVVTEVVLDCIHRVMDEPRITVRIAEPMLDELKDELEAKARELGYEGRLLVVGDGRLGPADCKLEWTEGGAERLSGDVWKEIEDLIDRHIDPGHGPEVVTDGSEQE